MAKKQSKGNSSQLDSKALFLTDDLEHNDELFKQGIGKSSCFMLTLEVM